MLDDEQLEDLFGTMINKQAPYQQEEDDYDSKDDLLEQADVTEIRQETPAPVEEKKVSSIELTKMIKDQI